MSVVSAAEPVAVSGVATVEHWFDFMCPFCRVALDRNRILREHGVRVVEHALQIHPEIGPGGAAAGPRVGPVYDFLAREAEEAGIVLRWSERMPCTRTALAASEWLRGRAPEAGERFDRLVSDAYFAEGLDIESEDLLLRLAGEAGADPEDLRAALASGDAPRALLHSENLAHEHGVTGTPAWIAGDERISGLRSREWFAEWATSLTS